MQVIIIGMVLGALLLAGFRTLLYWTVTRRNIESLLLTILENGFKNERTVQATLLDNNYPLTLDQLEKVARSMQARRLIMIREHGANSEDHPDLDYRLWSNEPLAHWWRAHHRSACGQMDGKLATVGIFRVIPNRCSDCERIFNEWERRGNTEDPLPYPDHAPAQC